MIIEARVRAGVAEWAVLANLLLLSGQGLVESVLGRRMDEGRFELPFPSPAHASRQQERSVDLYRRNDCEFFLKSIIPTHPDPEEVCARLKHEEAMRGALNWDRGNPLSEFFLAAAEGALAYEKCTVPTMGIWSSGDVYLLAEHVERTKDFMAADWRYERIEHASHWAMLDHPDEVNRLLLDWFGTPAGAR